MRGTHLLLLLLFTLFLITSCKKPSFEKDFNNQESITRQLFNLSDVQDKDIIEVASQIKHEGTEKNYLNFFLENNGVPLWSNAIKKGNNENFIALIPFIKSEIKQVEGFIVAIKYGGNKFGFSLFKKEYLKKYGFSKSNTLTATDVGTLINYFNRTAFNLTSARLSYAMQLPLDIRKKHSDKTSPYFLIGKFSKGSINNNNNEYRALSSYCFSITEEWDWWYDPDGDADPCDCSGNEYIAFTTIEVMNICIDSWGGGTGGYVENNWYIGDVVLGNSGGGGGTSLTTEQKLNAILQPGDTYYFMNNDPNEPQEPWEEEPINYGSVEEFENAIKNYKFESSVSFDQGIEKVLNSRINRTLIGGYDIKVKIRQNSSNVFEIISVTSEEWGLTPGWSWTQSQYTANVSGDIITVDVWGKEKYNIIVEGIGTVYSKEQHYRMEINKLTGKMISIKKI